MKIVFSLVLSLAAAVVHAKPGDVVSLNMLSEDTSSVSIVQHRQAYCPTLAGNSKASAFKRYKLTYKSVGLNGEEVETAGQLIVPQSATANPMLVYQHGTVMGRSELPSQDPSSPEFAIIAYCMASLDYVAVLPDYLGYGDSTGVHPYLHADSEAWVARDMMRAAQTAVQSLNAKLSSQVFIAGYSQGGHAAMALARMLDQDTAREFVVTAAAPMAGPYNIVRSVTEVFIHPQPNSVAEGAFLAVGLNQAHHFYQSLHEVFRPQYVPILTTLFDGSNDWTAVQSKLTMTLQELFQPGYLERAMLNPKSLFRTALEANAVDQWTPRMPMRLYHGKGDHEVPFSNSQLTYDYMRSHGAAVDLVNLGDGVDHRDGFPLAIMQAAAWFESLR